MRKMTPQSLILYETHGWILMEILLLYSIIGLKIKLEISNRPFAITVLVHFSWYEKLSAIYVKPIHLQFTY